jgi:hypothetical protein
MFGHWPLWATAGKQKTINKPPMSVRLRLRKRLATIRNQNRHFGKTPSNIHYRLLTVQKATLTLQKSLLTMKKWQLTVKKRLVTAQKWSLTAQKWLLTMQKWQFAVPQWPFTKQK